MELRSSGDALQACRRGGVCLKSSGALEAVQGRVGRIEVWSSGALAYCLLLLEFLAFVPQGSLLRSGLRRLLGGTPAKVSGFAPR